MRFTDDTEEFDNSLIGPALASICEGDGIEEYVEKLEMSLNACNKQVELNCATHYQNFIETVMDLIRAGCQAHLLCTHVKQFDATLRNICSDLINIGDELVRSRLAYQNLTATASKMALFSPLMNAYAKLKTLIENKRYYHALKTLERLEHDHLPRVGGAFSFCAEISASIPIFRKTIGEKSKADLTDFLERIARETPRVGLAAVQQTRDSMERDLATIVRIAKGNIVSNASDNHDKEYSIEDSLDFGPVYRSLHIHTILGSRQDLIDYYRFQRTQQVQLLLTPTTNLPYSSQYYRSYLDSIAGFFVIEDHLLLTGSGLVSKNWLSDLWIGAAKSVKAIMRESTSLETDLDLIMDVKQHLVLFKTTLKNYGFFVEPLEGLLLEMGERYTEILIQLWVKAFRTLLDGEDFSPIQAENEQQYDEILNDFHFNSKDLDSQDFPRKFPFSPMVLSVNRQIKEFIEACSSFYTNLGLTSIQKADQILHNASFLLNYSFNGCLISLFRKPSLALLQVVQIIIDTEHLERAVKHLPEFVGRLTECEANRNEVFHVTFKTSRDDAEKQICDKLKNKLDEFLENDNYDWVKADSTDCVSNFISDMIGFLKSILESLTTLSNDLAMQAFRVACAHLAQGFHELIAGPNIKQISLGALRQINLDVAQCEKFASNNPVPGLTKDNFSAEFSQLRQLLDLVIDWDWTNYLHDIAVGGDRYFLVKPNDAAVVLEKIKEADRRNSIFAILKKAEREKRKLMDTVLKQLKQLG